MKTRPQDWQEEKREALAHARLVIIKIGSAVLTDPAGLRMPVLENIAAQMAALREGADMPAALRGQGPARRIILVSSAAVAAGRATLARHGRHYDVVGLAARQAAAAVGQGRLMRAWDKAFAPFGLPTAQVLLTRDDLRARQRFLNARNTFAELLQWDVLPIVNENDTVSVAELKFGDNDCLSSLLVNLTGADLFINLTSAPGVLAGNPQENPDVGVMPCVENVGELDLGKLCGGKTTVGTGGMYSKLTAARRAAQLGVPTLILPGREPDIMRRAFAGEAVGTWVRPADHAISRRKFWLAYQSDPVGTICVDAGAAEALQHRGGSLLPGGVRQVEGNFQQGALVRIARLEAGGAPTVLGVGLSNYSAPDLRRIMGLKRIEVAAILGDAHYPEVIHRDNMLLEAAV